MGVKVATTCMHWSQSIVSNFHPSSQTLASSVSSPSKKRSRSDGGGALVCRCVQGLDRSSLFGASSSSRLYRSRSCEHLKSGRQTLRRACSASLDASSDEEFAKKIRELAKKFQLSDDDDDSDSSKSSDSGESESAESATDSRRFRNSSCDGYESSKFDGHSGFLPSRSLFPPLTIDHVEPPWLEPPDWPCTDEIIMASIERKANSVDLPFSLRIIQRKQQHWQEGFREAGGSACCSVKKAFSSMVFIIREMHSYTLQMREVLFYQDLQGILVRVQGEMHASFLWLFQQVFSHTPTLMVYVMILLANFTVHHAAIAAMPPAAAETLTVATETVSATESQAHQPEKRDSSAVRSFPAPSSGGKAALVGGNTGGGGGNVRPIAGGNDGDGRLESAEQYRKVVPDGASEAEAVESVSGQVDREEEATLWGSMVEEASTMRFSGRGEALDGLTMQGMVSPVKAEMESEDYYGNYFQTEVFYQTALAKDPSNPLLLSNFAHFLCVVAHDYDRAEEYFKRAIAVEPPDAEALNKYASFLWTAKKDLWAAEETYLEAISADPTNSFYAASYAHFLWSTGGEDTCFPLNSPDDEDTSNFA